MLPSAAGETLTGHLAEVRRLHEVDLARGFGRVVLPFALDRKCPNAPTDWRWQFVFPAGRLCRNPRYGPPSRYHLHKSVVQKAVGKAGRLAGIMTIADPDHSEDEQRFLSIGSSTAGRLLVVAYTERAGRTRIISAREASAQERRHYESSPSRR